MDLQEALKVLEITDTTYNLSTVKKRYHELLKINHPDNNIGASSKEKSTLIKQINIAFKVVKDKLENEGTIDEWHVIDDDYSIESQIPTLSLDYLPIDIKNIIDEYYRKYMILYKLEKMKLDIFSSDVTYSSDNYKEKYKNYRKDLTYDLFNYLQDNVQKYKNGNSIIYDMIYKEYCEKYNSSIPIILESIYGIVQKFVCFFSLYVQEIIKSKNHIKNRLIEKLNDKIDECQKKEYYSYIKEEIDEIIKYTLKRIQILFEGASYEKIDQKDLLSIESYFCNMIDDILTRYDEFADYKILLIENLENTIRKKVENEEDRNDIQLELNSLRREFNPDAFSQEFSRIKKLIAVTLSPDDEPKKLAYLKDEQNANENN